MSFGMIVRGLLASLLITVGVGVSSAQPALEAGGGPTLTIGSKAPQLDIEHWVHDGMGKLGPVTKFEDGHVYVVEFWATWCGPCIAAMPHISQLQRDYLEKDVTIVSISDEDLETVSKFLERNVRGEENQTYDELTKFYCLTTDPDRSSHQSYMQAAGQNGIPTAFLVGKQGLIEWIGHPMSIDEPLAQVVAGDWDREAFLAEFKLEQEMEIAMSKLGQLLQSGKGDEARAMVEDMLSRATGEQMKAQLSMVRMQVEFNIVQTLILEQDAEAAAAVAHASEMFKDEPQALNQLAWIVVQLSESGTEVSDELIDAAMTTIEKAVKAEPEDGSILDTLAHLVYAKGDLDQAIEIQTKALKFATPELKPSVEAFLKKMQDEK